MLTRRAVLWSVVAALGVALAAVAIVLLINRPDTGPAGDRLETIRAEAAVTAPSDSTPSPTTGATATPSGAVGTPPGPTLPEPSIRPGDPAAVAAAGVAAAPPVRVVVASLGIDAAVDPVGVRDDGSMTIPKSASRVGWYEFGPAPGDPAGNTVIAGHVDTAADGPGAMFRLREVQVGDDIVVESADGTRHEYQVAGKENVVKAALPVDQIFARDGRPLLVLVTCGGEFQPELRSYRENLVVTAVPMTAQP